MKTSERKVKKLFVLAVAVAACLKVSAVAVPYERLPVSDPCNPMYLKGMTDKPWWNGEWKFRLPVVVSESSTNDVAAFVADFEVDLGRAGQADSVRVVTDYGDEIPCWAGEVPGTGGGTWVRVQFKTQINAAENKCFHLYFGNPNAKRPAYPDEVTCYETDSLLTVRNSSLTVDFTRKTSNGDIVKRFKVNGSWADNELTLLPCQTVARAFRVKPSNGQSVFTNRVTLALSTPFMKQVKVENGVFNSTYTMFADSDRLDYSFVPTAKGIFFRSLDTSWAPGGGMAWDDLLYPSLVGTINTDRAQLDYRRDSGEPIKHPDLGDWSGEGWYAFCDRKTACSVGQFYSGADVRGVSQDGWSGESQVNCHSLNITLRPGNAKHPQGEIRGAAFGTLARVDVIQGEYRMWASPPRIFAGKPEPWRRIEVRPPDMAHDFCTFQQLGPGPKAIKNDEPGLPEESAENVARYLRRDGFNGAHLILDAARWWHWNPEKEVFDEVCAAFTNKTYGGDGKYQATWAQSQLGSRNMRAFLDTLHRNGIGAYHWGYALFQGPSTCDALLTQERPRELDIEVNGRTHAAFGFDATWCGMQGHEGPMMMQADWKKLGVNFWKYKDRADTEAFLRLQDMRVEHARKFSAAVRKAGGKSLSWGCDLGPLVNEQFSLNNAGDFDVVIQELMIGQSLNRNERNRFGIARMRAMFDNEPHTVWTHFWSRIAGDDIRVGNCDLPFIYGVNGFNQEADDYRQVDAEIVTKGTDFYRFAYNTGLAAFSPKFTPVKYFNVFRDQCDHRADILEGRTGKKWMYALGYEMTETDGAANIWTTAPSIHTDLTLNRFFTLKSLQRYPMLALPHNYMLTKEQFAIVLRYVKEGGICYAEGEKFPFAKEFANGATKVEKSKYGFSVRTFGKGKLLYSPKNPSLEKFALHPNREFRSFLVREIGRPEPLVVEPKYCTCVDGMVRTDGANWMFGSFALDMPGGTAAVVRATFNLPLVEGKKYFAVDMKSGRRVPFDGALEFVQRPRQVTNWLIGDEGFTAVPEHTVCRTFDFGAVKPVALTDGAKKNLVERKDLGDFTRPLAMLLFQEPGKDGKSYENQTVKRGSYEQKLMSRANYEAKAFQDVLASAKVLQLRALRTDIVERVFAENGDALKAFLGRGGSILFDRTKTSPAATSFLRDVGVYDVNESRVTGGDRWGEANFADLGKDHELFTKPWDIYQPWISRRMQGGNCFTKWDAKKQFAPFVIVERDRPDKSRPAAMCVCQDNVCGAGRVIFQENDGAFTSWYEGITYGENLLSWAFGLDFKTHKRKVQLLYGGFGTPVEFPAVVRNGF